jgi:hypothetical protein
MRRLMAVAAFLVLAASVQLYAQHGGGHGSAGGHAGFSSHGSFSGHSSAFSGSHSSFAPRSNSRGSSSFHSPASRYNSRARNSSRSLRLRTYGNGFRNNCYGYPCRGYGNPWGYGAFDPNWWWDNSGSDFDYDQQYQTGLANEMNQQSLDEQRMRQQGDQDLYARSAPPPPHQRSEHEEINEAAPATVLVFRDEHKQEIHNYAIVGQTLWNFNPQHTQKIPLSDLDIPATTKENDERGVDFRVPGPPVGQ